MKRKKRKKLIILLTIILVVLMGIATAIYLKLGSRESSAEGTLSLKLAKGLEIVEVGPYSGSFVEDGTNDEVKNVFMVVVKNTGERTVKHANFTIKYGETKAEFTFSVLLPGEEVIVLEKNRLEYVEETEVKKPKAGEIEYFEDGFNQYDEYCTIEQMEGVFEVNNVSEDTLKAPIVVYYKNWIDGRYVGGITYSVTLEEDVEPGEYLPVEAENYTTDTGEVMYVTFGQ